MKPEIKIFATISEIAEEFASTLQTLASEANGLSVHIALSGGSTPKAIFKYLTSHYGKSLANTQFHFWWGDERCVSPTDDDSNYKWANELWLSPIGIPQKNIHRVLGEDDPEKEAIRYAEEMEALLPFENGWPVFDLMLLGLGEDGHTASIFPHQIALISSEKLCEVATHPESGQKRITITGNVINNSRVIAFLSTGEKKAQKVYEIIKLKDKTLPATHISPKNGKLVWLLNNEAAKQL